ncbi:phage tail-like protein [Ulvibacter sp. MAR_2010_11]|uniref:phage tail protein n=1 Tax=Ulvibacter sp. MAR_2010_11 TaxID=1250229 RepID=UPI000C2B680E|nr:phage tail protein [Ulvibacter sp. MAR_2010_11]PKA83072.1 phage tail-like protein [Ulvibacter sp. MAR_2010_11]
MEEAHPSVSFNFRLSLSGLAGLSDASFTEVSGISMEMNTEEIADGGNNSFKHRVPTSAKFSNLILKRGLISKNSEIANWCLETFSEGLSGNISTKTVVVTLLNENGLPLKAWKFVNARPIKWSASGLNLMNNEILIETLEFAYSYCEEVGV